MRANVSISNIYWNKALAIFFFRKQAYERLEELVRRSTLISGDETLDALNFITEGMDIDDVEEMFYQNSVEEIAEEFGIKLDFDDDDNE